MSFITRDVWIGLVMMLVAVVYWLEADKIRISPLDGPVGASGLPKALAYALGVLAVILIAKSIIGRLAERSRAVPADAEDNPLAFRPHLRAIGLLAIGVGYLLLVPWFGYTITIAGLLLAVSLYIGAAFTPRTLLIAVIGGVFYYLLFVQFLGIPLPAGKILGSLGFG
ncbi:MAG: tripartite tricarboxylate transporter TctB family protein [Geminicoccaceae bacterium]